MANRSHHTTPEELRSLIGQQTEDARKEAEGAGYRFRVSFSDGSAHLITRDYRLDRINVETIGGAVVAAWFG